jgi:CubicO group peptidase (beta-lactamase class C family)
MKKILGVLILVFITTVSCTTKYKDIQSFETVWQKASAEDVGLNPALMDRLIQDAHEGRFPNLHALIVVKDSRIVVEEYFGEFDAKTRHYTASVTKSVGSMLVGIAMDQGLLPGLDDGVLDMRLSELFPEYQEILAADPRKADIRFRHILSMSAGFEWDEDTYPYDDQRNDWVRVRDASEPARLVLEQRAAHNPGKVFNYSGGLSILLAYLIERETDMGTAAFAKRYLFEPLGISDYEWKNLTGGLIDFPGGLSLRPRDMAKLGQLCLNGGRWNGESIVSKDWVTESTREHIISINSPNYGFQWWCGKFYYHDRSVYLYMASGHGGQKIFVVPDFSLVVILAHKVFDNPAGEMHNTAIMSRYILPASDPFNPREVPVEVDIETLSHFVGAYASSNGQFKINIHNGRLKVTAQNTESMYLVPISRARFRGTVQDLIDVEFVFDITDDGKVQGGWTSYAFAKDSFVRVLKDSK